MGGDPIVRSTNSNSNNQASQPPADISAEIVEALLDGEELIVDGFRRVSVLGLEVGMLDGPFRVRTMTPKTERRSDASPRPRK